MCRVSLYFKLGALGIALALVIFVMRVLTPSAMEGVFASLGIEPGAGGSTLQAGGAPLEPGQERRSLCHTRLHAVRFADGRAVVEARKGMKLDWTAEEAQNEKAGGKSSAEARDQSGGKPIVRSLSYLDIEKWLSQHCQFVAAQALDQAPGASERVLFEYIDGSKWEVLWAGSSFLPRSEPREPFYSPDLAAALLELRELAGFPVDSARH